MQQYHDPNLTPESSQNPGPLPSHLTVRRLLSAMTYPSRPQRAKLKVWASLTRPRAWPCRAIRVLMSARVAADSCAAEGSSACRQCKWGGRRASCRQC